MPKHGSVESIRSKIKGLAEPLDREINIDVFVNPSKYLKRLPLEKIVADSKVSRRGVERYKEKIVKGENIPPIIVVKHPTKDIYAVLDGHHRYYAYLELEQKEVDCAVAGDFSGIIFYMTKRGLFQPHSEITERIRVPALRFHENVKQFLSDFSKDPYKIEKLMNDYIKRLKNSLSS
jgi:hypothetical protein